MRYFLDLLHVNSFSQRGIYKKRLLIDRVQNLLNFSVHAKKGAHLDLFECFSVHAEGFVAKRYKGGREGLSRTAKLAVSNV